MPKMYEALRIRHSTSSKSHVIVTLATRITLLFVILKIHLSFSLSCTSADPGFVTICRVPIFLEIPVIPSIKLQWSYTVENNE
ncbi:hypothetical protein BT96DRAFT_912990 [Gymnopus androsaceus JB14]|uniref:Uncharacterized protein n=1 Tax=Gymnopus androsaceus JB14 TaxID=1447944 RepID=A0A6A4II07_9AGAR|nr:hypothetical protein BT96DRAFT_912990 [Gymnopus androsaceus JB14]